MSMVDAAAAAASRAVARGARAEAARSSPTRGGGTSSGSSPALIALFPIWFIASAAFNARPVGIRDELPADALHAAATSRRSSTTPSSTRAARATSTRRSSAGSAELDPRRGRRRALHGHPVGARRVRVQPVPLQGPALRDARAAADPDVPAAAARRRDLPDRPQHRRDLRLPRAQHVHRARDRLPRRRARREHVADEGLLRHDPDASWTSRRASTARPRRRSSGASSCRWRRRSSPWSGSSPSSRR